MTAVVISILDEIGYAIRTIPSFPPYYKVHKPAGYIKDFAIGLKSNAACSLLSKDAIKVADV